MKCLASGGLALGFIAAIGLQAAAQGTKIQQEVEDHIKTLKTSKDDQRKLNALQRLGEIAAIRTALTKPAVPAVVDMLKDGKGEVRRAAAQALVIMAPEPKLAAKPLASLLSDGDRDTRLAAAQALVNLGKGAAEVATEILAAQKKEAAQEKKDDELLGLLNRAAGAVQLANVTLGSWYYIGPFDNTGGQGFKTAYPPEKDLDLKKKHKGKGNIDVAWQPGNFTDGEINDLALFGDEKYNNDAVVYLYREIECIKAQELPISLGSDDTLSVWLNGERLLNEEVYRGAAADQNRLTLRLREGKNHLLLKICQGSGDWAFYFAVSAGQ